MSGFQAQNPDCLYENTILHAIAIPFIYAGLFLKSMWDPYGNLDKLPVAVVNEDRPVEYEGNTLSIGDDLTDALKENDSLDFHFVDRSEAQEGLKDGTWYMVITIPEDFSGNAATLLDDSPRKMQLDYETNPGSLTGSRRQAAKSRKLRTDRWN